MWDELIFNNAGVEIYRLLTAVILIAQLKARTRIGCLILLRFYFINRSIDVFWLKSRNQFVNLAAIDCISSLAHSSDSSHVTLIAGKKYDMKYSLICLAAQHALEKNKRQIAMATLRHLAMTGNNDKAKLTAYRSAVTLKIRFFQH